MSEENNQWLSCDYAHSFLESEAHYLKLAINQISGPNVLLASNIISASIQSRLDFPNLFVLGGDSSTQDRKTLLADVAFLPFPPEALSTVILPHVLETNSLPHQVLRETHRVLQPEGYVVLTGFNPYSLIGCQRLINYKTRFKGNYYPIHRIKDWLQLLGFEVVSSAMFHYAPLSKSQRARSSLSFINSVGDRWLPMLGGGYMILAKKKEHGMTWLGSKRKNRLRFPASKSKPALAKGEEKQ